MLRPSFGGRGLETGAFGQIIEVKAGDVAILPAGMSKERFDWLDRWCENPADDVIRTVGTESNVKEIYDACNELAKDPGNFVLNQFCEFGNHLGHYEVTGRAFAHVFEHVRATTKRPGLRLAAFTSATGSACQAS